MPRSDSIDEIIDAAVERVVQRIVLDVQRALSEAASQRGAKGRLHSRRPGSPRRRQRRGELTRWVADNRARRVPTFVIQATGLDTKKRIVARYGANVTFEKGKPLPPALPAAARGSRAAKESGAVAARVAKARPPMVREVG